jgi:hypothetical protein
MANFPDTIARGDDLQHSKLADAGFEPQKFTLNDKLFFAGVTILSYASALMFEIGYTNWFSFSQELIVVDYQRVLVSSIFTIWYLYCLGIIAFGYLKERHRGSFRETWKSSMVVFVLAVLFPSQFIVRFVPKGYETWFFIVSTSGFAAVFLWNATRIRETRVAQAVKKVATSGGAAGFPNIFELLDPFLDSKLFLCVCASPLFVMCALIFGYVAASRESHLQFLQDGSNRALVRVFGSNAVTVVYDRANGVPTGEISVFPMIEMKQYRLQMEPVKLPDGKQHPALMSTTKPATLPTTRP